MIGKKNYLLLSITFLLPVTQWLQAQPISDQKIDSIFSLEKKYIGNAWAQVLQTGKMPRSTERGLRPIEDWTSGFFPGIIWLTYAYTGDAALKRKGEYALKMIKPNQYYTGNHDIGFMIYCSYGTAYTTTHNPTYKKVIIQAAKSAITRYNPTIRSIMSWNPDPKRDWKFPVIIDNMMNLEMLLKATAITGDSSFYTVAVNHANTTMQNQYRANYSCSHVVDYDPATGAMRKRDWNNGNNDPSTAAWSRGQAWGLYGFGFMYRDTHNSLYLQQATHIANYIINHPNMPTDMVPYWDFNAPKIPTMKDASAAAIIAAGLLQLAPLANVNSTKYFKAAETILNSLTSRQYLNKSRKGYFLIKHATGNYLKSSELDAGLIYADYYFLEALSRYKKLKPQFNKG